MRRHTFSHSLSPMELRNRASWLTLLSTWHNLELSEKTGSIKEFSSSDRARCLRLRKGLWVVSFHMGFGQVADTEWGSVSWLLRVLMIQSLLTLPHGPASEVHCVIYQSWGHFWLSKQDTDLQPCVLSHEFTAYNGCKHREGDGERDQEIQPGPWAGTSCLNTIRAGSVQLLQVSQEWLFSVWGCGGWREEESKDVPFSIGVEDAICFVEGAIPSSWEWIRSVFDSEAFISSWRAILCKTAVTPQPAVKRDRHSTFPDYGFFLPNHLTHLLGWWEPCRRRQLAMHLG